MQRIRRLPVGVRSQTGNGILALCFGAFGACHLQPGFHKLHTEYSPFPYDLSVRSTIT